MLADINTIDLNCTDIDRERDSRWRGKVVQPFRESWRILRGILRVTKRGDQTTP